jgi:hypothetical protein
VTYTGSFRHPRAPEGEQHESNRQTLERQRTARIGLLVLKLWVRVPPPSTEPVPVMSLEGPGSLQLTALFTSAAIVFSSAAVNSFNAYATGHIVPLSRFAESLKPNIAYRSLNLAASRKKQTTLPSLA